MKKNYMKILEHFLNMTDKLFFLRALNISVYIVFPLKSLNTTLHVSIRTKFVYKSSFTVTYFS